MLSYPTEDKKGLYTSVFWVIFNLGGVIGSAVAVGTNWNSNDGSVTNSTYIAFVVLAGIGALLPVTLIKPTKMLRDDGTPVVIERQTTWKTELLNLYRSLIDDPWIGVSRVFFFKYHNFNNQNFSFCFLSSLLLIGFT